MKNALFVLALGTFSLSAAAIAAESQHSGNAVQEAQKQADATRDAELRNNVNASSADSAKGGGETAIYPKSSAPDVADSYNSENKTLSVPGQANQQRKAKKYHGEKTTGSSTLDSLSGSSRIPDNPQEPNATKSGGSDSNH